MTESLRFRTGVGALALSALSASAFGCQDYLFEEKRQQEVKEAQIQKPGIERTPADILFVVDNSGSMADEQENLARNFDAFINEVVAGSGDYQIAVVSTDLVNPTERGGLVESRFSTTAPFNLLSIDSGMCTTLDIAQGCFRGNDPATRIISSERIPDRAAQIAAFQSNVRLGSCGAGAEQGMKAAVTALQKAASGGCNAGFLRPDANLVIVIVSDEEDADTAPVSQYVDAILALKPASQVRLALVVGAVDGEAKTCRVPNNPTCGSLCQRMPAMGSNRACGAGQPPCTGGELCDINQRCNPPVLQYWTSVNCGWCSYYNEPDCCSALGGSRYVEFGRLLEGRVAAADRAIPIQQCRGTMAGEPIACLIDSICQDNFSATLSRIARELVVNSSFVLNPPTSYPPGVVVRVNGVDLVNGEDFEVSEDGTTVRLRGSAVPKEGENVEVYYVIKPD